MKNYIYATFAVSLLCTTATAQLTLKKAKTLAREHKMTSYSYHTKFEGHKGYGAPIIITKDGYAAFFAKDTSGITLVKIDTAGKVLQSTEIAPKHDEIETQSIVEDKHGNLYAFMISYNRKKYRGGSERVICMAPSGEIKWDKTLGAYTVDNNPHCSYIHLNGDGKIELRGHIVKDKPLEGKDPVYHYWTGWLDETGKTTHHIGEVIAWGDEAWKNFTRVQ